MKETKRRAFNFLRSYFDVLNELKTDKDKLDFLMAIINKQFLNEDPDKLSFLANLCYQSQRHQIESSVKGWERASKETLGTALPTTPTTDPSTTCKEEEEKEEEKEEKSMGKIDFDKLLAYINKKTGRSFRTINKDLRKKYNARLNDGYTKEDIITAINNACKATNHRENNFTYLTPEFFTRAVKLDMYCATVNVDNNHIKNKTRTVEETKNLFQ